MRGTGQMPSTASDYAVVLPGVAEMRTRSVMSGSDLLTLVTRGTCEDQLPDVYLAYMRYILQDPSISACEDVKKWCVSMSFLKTWGPDGGKGFVARMICPSTCGCDDPSSALFYLEGCPDACTTTDHVPFASALKNSNCSQSSTKDLVQTDVWKSWSRQVHDYGVYVAKPEYVLAAKNMLEMGCNFGRLTPMLRCRWPDSPAPFKDLGMLCPRSCMCQSFKPEADQNYRMNNCPSQCGTYEFHRRRRDDGRRRSYWNGLSWTPTYPGRRRSAVEEYKVESGDAWPPPGLDCSTDDEKHGCCERNASCPNGI